MHGEDIGVNPRSGDTPAAGSPNVILMRDGYVNYTQIGITIRYI